MEKVKKDKIFSFFSLDILLYKVVYYKHTKERRKSKMKTETVEKCKQIFYKIVKENDDDLKKLSRVAVKMFDTMFECNCESKDEEEHYEMSKWIRETLLKYCIAMYDDDKQVYIKDDGTLVIYKKFIIKDDGTVII